MTSIEIKHPLSDCNQLGIEFLFLRHSSKTKNLEKKISPCLKLQFLAKISDIPYCIKGCTQI